MQLPRLEETRNTEVNQENMTPGINHDIGRFEIAKNNCRLAAMQVAEYITELLCPIDDLVNWKRATSGLLQVFFYSPTIDEVHHQVGAFIFCKMVVDARQVGMEQVSEQESLVFKGGFSLLSLNAR